MSKLVPILVVLALVAGAAYFFRDDLMRFKNEGFAKGTVPIATGTVPAESVEADDTEEPAEDLAEATETGTVPAKSAGTVPENQTGTVPEKTAGSLSEAPKKPTYTAGQIAWLKKNYAKKFTVKCPKEEASVDLAKAHLGKGRFKFAEVSPDRAKKLRYEVKIEGVKVGVFRFGDRVSHEKIRAALEKELMPQAADLSKLNAGGFGTVINGPTRGEISKKIDGILAKSRLDVRPYEE